ncbi:MAG: glycosyl transferase family 2, partial [Bacteroidia bacterium]|nr:glycosyl transferase family 2 [Bacteroidia bacterium]
VISAARSQQFRWNKGGAENFRKMLVRILKSKNITLKTKLHGIVHLLNSTMFLSVLIVAILSVPMLYIKHQYAFIQGYFVALSFFIITTIIYFMCYWHMYKTVHGKGFKNFIAYIGMFFTFFSIAMGFSIHNTLAVIEGHLGMKSDFIRTPKFNLNASNKNWKENKYISNKISVSTILEGLLMLYFAFGMFSSFLVKEHGVDFGLFPFHLMLFLGFGYVFVQSLKTHN